MLIRLPSYYNKSFSRIYTQEYPTHTHFRTTPEWPQNDLQSLQTIGGPFPAQKQLKPSICFFPFIHFTVVRNMQGHQFHPDSLTSQSTRSRLHLHCRNSCGKTTSMIPFIIFVFFWIWQPWHVPLVAGGMVCSTVPTKPARSRIPWSRVGYKIFIQGFHQNSCEFGNFQVGLTQASR